jgi:hypothetical protein
MGRHMEETVFVTLLFPVIIGALLFVITWAMNSVP